MKTWIIKDTDGNLPTEQEAEQIKEWLTHRACRPRVGITFAEKDGKTFKCEWRLTERSDGRTIASLDAEKQHVEHLLKDQSMFLQAVKMAAEANDLTAIRKLFKIED